MSLPPSAIFAHADIATHTFLFGKPFTRGRFHLADEIGMSPSAVQRAIKCLAEPTDKRAPLIRIERGRNSNEVMIYAEPIDQTRYLRAYLDVLKNQSLTGNEKLIFCLIASYTLDENAGGAFYGGIDSICAELHINAKTATLGVRKLIDLGMVEKNGTAYRALIESTDPPPDSEHLDGKNESPEREKMNHLDGKNESPPFKEMNSNKNLNIYGNQKSFHSMEENGEKSEVDVTETGFTAAPEMATAPPGTPKKAGEDENPMSVPPPMVSTQEDAPNDAAPMPDAPPKHSADESAAPDHAPAVTRESEERPTAPIIPGLTSKTREEREISVLDQILADGFNGFWPRLTEYQTWFDFWEEQKWIKKEHPDYFMDFRTHHREQIRRDMPKDEAFRRKWHETEPIKRAQYKQELEDKLHELKERITAT